MPTDASSLPASIEARIFVTGANHRTAGQEIRDALFIDARQLFGFYEHLRGLGVDEAMVLATCDRVTVAGLASEPERAERRVRAALSEFAGIADARMDNVLFTLQGANALDHLFAIASSLESQVVGEPEVLGQVKEAYRRGVELGAVGGGLRRVFDAAFACAKRARTETAIGECAVSIVSAAVQVAGEVLGRFDDARALMIGGAEIGVTLIERLKGEGLDQVTVADPVAPRGEALAARLGAHRIGMEDIPGQLARFDIVVTGVGGREPVLGEASVDAALRARRFRPIFLLDAAVPPDIDRGVRELDDAYLFDLHDLERIALTGQEKRGQAAAEARAIVEDEVARFLAADSGRRAAPVVAELRAHFEEMREGVLREQPGISADEATRLLVNRLLHAPSRALRDMAADRVPSEKGAEPSAEAGLIHRLFGLSRRGRKDESE